MSIRKRTTSTLVGCLLSLAASQSLASVFVPHFLNGSVFETAAHRSGLDALLLYSVALAESASGKGGGMAGPSPLAIRAGKDAFYPQTRHEAEQILQKLLAAGRKNVDVGVMQINLRWHGDRVSSPYELFDPNVNLKVASEILLETMASSPNDVRVAIGRYHNWELEKGGPYADRVLRIYKGIKQVTTMPYAN